MTLKNGKKAVLFDLDGTLVDSVPHIRQTYTRVFTDMEIPYTNTDPVEWLGKPLLAIAERFAGPRAGEFFNKYLEYYYQRHDEVIKLFPGTKELLEDMRGAGLLAGVVTSKRRPAAVRAIELTGIGVLLDVVVTVDDVIEHKPHPEPVLKALGALDVSPVEAVFIGDSCYDLEAGMAAGVESLGVAWGVCAAETLWVCRPAGVLDSWSQLRAYLGIMEVGGRRSEVGV